MDFIMFEGRGFIVTQTYCQHWEECKEGMDCWFALDLEIWLEAEKAGKPVRVYKNKPECFEELEDDN